MNEVMGNVGRNLDSYEGQRELRISEMEGGRIESSNNADYEVGDGDFVG